MQSGDGGAMQSDAGGATQSGVSGERKLSELSAAEYQKLCLWQAGAIPYVSVPSTQICVIGALYSRDDSKSCKQSAAACNAGKYGEQTQHEYAEEGPEHCKLAAEQPSPPKIDCPATIAEFEACLTAITSDWAAASCDDASATKAEPPAACAGDTAKCIDLARFYPLDRDATRTFACAGGGTIPSYQKCDFVPDCADGSDEEVCD
jgi:hypothetical protein